MKQGKVWYDEEVPQFISRLCSDIVEDVVRYWGSSCVAYYENEQQGNHDALIAPARIAEGCLKGIIGPLFIPSRARSTPNYTWVSDVWWKSHLSVGVGSSVAASIIGRTAEADFQAGDGGCVACHTYSCSKALKVLLLVPHLKEAL